MKKSLESQEQLGKYMAYSQGYMSAFRKEKNPYTSPELRKAWAGGRRDAKKF